MHRTIQLRDLARALGCMVVVTPQKEIPSIGSADAPSEILTASIKMDGLIEALDSDFEFEQN